MRFQKQRNSLREFKRELRLWRRNLTLRHLMTRLRIDPQPQYDEYGVDPDLERQRLALRDIQEKRRR